MYNIMYGRDEQASDALKAAGLLDRDLGRYRDSFFTSKNIDGQLKLVVAVLCRNGGDNRLCSYRSIDEDDIDDDHGGVGSPVCECNGCIITYASQKFDNFLYDEDADFDYTYAFMYFSILPEYKDNEHLKIKPTF